VRYGGNTSCVELRSDAGTLIVLDCGTGARELGKALVEEAERDGDAASGAILLGHTHWDHIQGLPFFDPLFGAGHWDVYGPRGLGTSLNQTLAGQMNYQYFPVALDQLGPNIEYHELVEGRLEIDGVVVDAQYLNHPALTLGYRIEADGAVICYIADHEPFESSLGSGGNPLDCPQDARHVAFLSGADLVIHDSQYDASEYADKMGWGHSTMQYAVAVCCAAGVRRTVLFHHDPSHDDAVVDDLLARANEQAAGRTTVVAAAEGAVLDVSGSDRRPPVSDAPSRSAAATPAVEELSATVVVATPDAELHDMVIDAARAERLPVMDAGDATEALDSIERVIVVVDVDSDDGVLDHLRSVVAPNTWTRWGVLAVTRTNCAPMPMPAPVSDWLIWPASDAHVRTKLRAAVLRRACRWLAAPLTPDEATRLASLHGLGLLDTEAEDRFDRLTEEACRRFNVPISLITFVDRDRQWFKSHQGIEFSETPRDQSLCAHAIHGSDVMQVADMLTDDRFADNPVTGVDARIRFYAGAPLTLDDGSRVGTLCIADHRPRLLDDTELAALRRLADEVVDELQAPR
jgi:phosphoribosyl 1,2-cyclic phosphodiesterase